MRYFILLSSFAALDLLVPVASADDATQDNKPPFLLDLVTTNGETRGSFHCHEEDGQLRCQGAWVLLMEANREKLSQTRKDLEETIAAVRAGHSVPKLQAMFNGCSKGKVTEAKIAASVNPEIATAINNCDQPAYAEALLRAFKANEARLLSTCKIEIQPTTLWFKRDGDLYLSSDSSPVCSLSYTLYREPTASYAWSLKETRVCKKQPERIAKYMPVTPGVRETTLMNPVLVDKARKVTCNWIGAAPDWGLW